MSFPINEIKIKAHAKINLSLYVKGLRNDGYHLLDSVFVPVSIYDEVTVKKAYGINIKCSSGAPSDETNTAYKAAKLLSEELGIGGADITIKKGIPSMAGLGGGSADAAAVLVAMNKLYDLGANNEMLANIGVRVGADVPFFLGDGAARVQGIGEIITPINVPIKLNLLLIKPFESLSTAQVYKKYDQIAIAGDGSCDALIDSLEKGRLHAACRTMHNDLEKPASIICTEVKKTIGFLSDNGALAAKMTGSGSCVFGVFHSAEAAGRALVDYYGSGTAFFATSKDTPLEMF